MDDLRRRFASLDHVRTPDQWDEIERRAAALGTTQRLMPVPVAVTRSRGFSGRSLVVLVAALALLVALLGGVIAVGSGLIRRTVVNDQTPPAAVSLDCAAAQASAAVRTNAWSAGPALTSPQPGWIAVWGTASRPDLILLHPVTGETCPLITFDDFNAPSDHPATEAGPRDWIPMRGSLSWSPDGSALAMIVAESQPCCRYALYVWSGLGLAGPIIDVREPSYLHAPSWSPDGSLLAVGESTGSIPGAHDPASAWIIAGDGSAPREVRADCDACFGGSVYWSPSGDQVAFRTWSNQDNGESLGIVAGGVDEPIVPLVPDTHGGDGLLGWASDESLWVVPFGVTVPLDVPEGAGRLFEVPLDPRLNRVDHGFLPAGPGVMPGGAVISPDGRQVLQLVERPRSLTGDLMLAGFPSGSAQRMVEGLPSIWGPMWWSPDGRTIGYLIDVQTPDQGIWLVSADGTGHRKLVSGSFVIGRDTYGSDDTLLKVWQPVREDDR
jgi:hypothetical protein